MIIYTFPLYIILCVKESCIAYDINVSIQKVTLSIS